MKYAVYNKKRLKIAHVWFSDCLLNIINIKADIIYLHGYKDYSSKFTCIGKQYTLISDFQNSNELFKSLNKTLKYEINRSQKEDVIFKIYFNNDISDDILKSFKRVYESMYKSKGMKIKLSLSLIKEYINNNMFIITTATKDGNVLVYHAFVYDENQVRLLYSCSDFRISENKSLIGRCNKYLHWRELDYCLNKKLLYDWGGISSFESPNGIDKFKLDFLGKKNEYYNYIVGLSVKGKIVEKIYRRLKL